VLQEVTNDPGMASTSTTTPPELISQSIQNSVDDPAEIHGDFSSMVHRSITQEPDEKVSVFKVWLQSPSLYLCSWLMYLSPHLYALAQRLFKIIFEAVGHANER
jgi:hypothetical protein